jgi:hypothetical protein
MRPLATMNWEVLRQLAPNWPVERPASLPKTVASPTVIITMLAFVFVLTASLARGEEPSLSETLAWIDSTFNPHKSEGGSFGYGIEENYLRGKLIKRRTETFSYDGCVMHLLIQDDPRAQESENLYTSTRYSFNLHDIDLASIKTVQLDSQAGGLSCNLNPNTLTCDEEIMYFETRDKAGLIDEERHSVYPKLQGRDHELDSTSKTFVLEFLFNDVEYAAHFVKAFHHAVTLCGGKASPF